MRAKLCRKSSLFEFERQDPLVILEMISSSPLACSCLVPDDWLLLRVMFCRCGQGLEVLDEVTSVLASLLPKTITAEVITTGVLIKSEFPRAISAAFTRISAMVYSVIWQGMIEFSPFFMRVFV